MASMQLSSAQFEQEIVSLINTGRHDQALRLCDQGLTSAPEYPRLLELKAKALMSAKRPHEAYVILKPLLEVPDPRDELMLLMGRCELDRREFGAAESWLKKVAVLHPKDPVVMHDLAAVATKLGRLGEAVDLFERSAKTGYPMPEMCWRNRSIVLRRMGRLDEAYENAQIAIKISGQSPEIEVAIADVLSDMGRLDEAEVLLNRVAKTNPSLVIASRARLLLLKGNYPEGFREFDKYLQMQGYFRRTDIPGTQWTGKQPLKDKTILIYDEQGFGDTLQYIRYADLLEKRGAVVFADVRTPLKQIISRVKGVSWVVSSGQARPKYDFRVPMLNLPMVMGSTLENIPSKIPYLSVPPRLNDYWRERTADDKARLRVGICWKGNPHHEEDHRRSMPPEYFIPLGQLKDVSFYNLQRDVPEESLKPIAGPLRLIDYSARLNDFADTAALINNLDIVLSIDSALAHLTGGLGKPIWLMLCYAGEWRWLRNREDSPWYPTMRIFRQTTTTGGDWADVIERIANELNNYQSTRISNS